ncbi:anthrone oxygenase family protein [Sphaerisporangium sp. NPDC005288]|uniref:anthrone oxygenase family protein n=1 Tax=Sphaerisporangium sp. NPDC005288 TaxID=3155114 RepID=UPI0033ABB729
MLFRLVKALTAVTTGLLAGAFGYGVVNVVYAFHAVPVPVRLTFHAALMQVNGVVMQALMGLTLLSTLALAVMAAGVPRLLAAASAALVLTTFLITRFGNVPLHPLIEKWAVTSPPPGYAAVLDRWEMFNLIRTGTVLTAFALVVLLLVTAERRRPPGAKR